MESELGRVVTAAIESIGDEAGLEIYDELIADPEAIGGSFYWYPRERLARLIARRRVLERLPSDLSEVIEVAEQLGYDPRAA
jgi:hypothetical protein